MNALVAQDNEALRGILTVMGRRLIALEEHILAVQVTSQSVNAQQLVIELQMKQHMGRAEVDAINMKHQQDHLQEIEVRVLYTFDSCNNL